MISTTITDNCSNLVATFKEHLECDGTDDEDNDGECADDGNDDEIDDEDFLESEERQDEEFICYNRVGCFSHALQLVVNKFSDYKNFRQLVKHTHALVRKVNSSTKATERLIFLKLTKDCPIRWSSTFLM